MCQKYNETYNCAIQFLNDKAYEDFSLYELENFVENKTHCYHIAPNYLVKDFLNSLVSNGIVLKNNCNNKYYIPKNPSPECTCNK